MNKTEQLLQKLSTHPAVKDGLIIVADIVTVIPKWQDGQIHGAIDCSRKLFSGPTEPIEEAAIRVMALAYYGIVDMAIMQSCAPRPPAIYDNIPMADYEYRTNEQTGPHEGKHIIDPKILTKYGLIDNRAYVNAKFVIRTKVGTPAMRVFTGLRQVGENHEIACCFQPVKQGHCWLENRGGQ